jgi:hypothetical protein
VGCADCNTTDNLLIVLDLGNGTCNAFEGLTPAIVGDCTKNIFNGTQCTYLDSDLVIVAANAVNATSYKAPDFQKYFDALGIGNVVTLSAPSLNFIETLRCAMDLA